MNAEQAIDTAKSLQRIQNYLERLEVAKGYHKECIHAFIGKDGEEIPLLVADLKALLQQVTTALSNTDAKDAARYRWLRARDLETIGQGGVFAGMTPQNVILNGQDLDDAIDAALAAQAKQGEQS